MKKFACVLVLMATMVLMNTSCTKSTDDTPDVKTLAQQNPTWVKLTWVSTNGLTTIYPRLDISISGNVAIIQVTESIQGVIYHYNFDYDGLSVTVPTATTTGIATFSMPHSGAVAQTMKIYYSTDTTQVKLRWKDNSVDYDFVLKVN
jgi:hypothetical protein